MIVFNRPRKISFDQEEDIHSHLLPAMDDGVETLDESIGIITRMAKRGVKRLTCTPHIAHTSASNDPRDIRDVMTLLGTHLRRQGIEITLDAAAEYKMGEFMLELIREDRIIASNRGEVLIEHSFIAPSAYYEDIVFNLQNRGFQPVLAHPERYPFYAKDVVGNCQEAKAKGCKIQVNLLSFTGYYGKEVMKRARRLYDSGCVDYYAGDIHNMHQEMLIEKLIGGASF